MLPQKRRDLLISYCQNRDEAEIVSAIHSKSLGETQAEYVVNLIDILAEWRWMAGVSTNGSEDDMAQELVMIAKFVSENYPLLKHDEFKLAVNLSLTNRLDVDVRTFNSFSPMYVSRILNAYLDHKSKSMREVIVRKERDDLKKEMEKQPTQEEKMQHMVELINYLYEEYKATGEIKDHFTILYGYLKKTNKIRISKEQIEEAMNYGKQKAKLFEPTTYEKIFQKQDSDNSIIEKRFARNYCIQKLFDEIGLEGMIAKVELKDF
jgi:hypothetical protein